MNGTATHPDPELDLLGDDPSTEYTAGAHHSSRTAPVFSGDALDMLGTSVFPQRALYGRLISQHAPQLAERPSVPKVYINTNTPFSAVVCGVQGSGKSHSASVLLESCLIKDTRIGILPEPLSALLFHFDTAAGGGFVQPCEAAYLSQLNPNLRGEGIVPPPVTVLVVPSYLQSMKKVYAGLPNVRVEPLLFGPGDISGERLLSMMKVDESSQMPLYMESIMAILRSMQDEFDYYAFRTAIEQQGFNRSQMSMLRIRLSLLDSCLEGGTIENSVASHFGKGQLTIIDLSSPFMDGSTACGFFDMILGLFIEADIGVSGKLVVLDEAHKYLSESQTGSSGRLTESLLSVIRQQRHLATRIVISTQEPTVIPSKFLALCSIIIAHRFSSPMWLKELGQHVSAAQGSTEELFSQIIALPTGHAIMFAPNALCVRDTDNWGEEDGSKSRSHGLVSNLGQGYLQVRSRLRLTRDGGHSLLAVADPEHTTRLDRVSARSGAAAGAASSSGVNGWNLPAHKPLTPQPRVSATQDTASR
ncbi:hypothetical protein BDW22DRAFT_1469295 [Trametopsis cervina]|nr:hypothetical protein BDW22DRAFT_1469295 [Trametopsis cervina]